jgi:TonB family protein
LEKRGLTIQISNGDITQMPGAGVGAGIGLVVLSSDNSLLDTLDSVVTSDHSIAHCLTEAELAEQIVAARCGVALIDIAAVNDSPAELTRRLRQQFPDLVLVVAGLAEHQAALAAQIASGEIYRFLHKPVSAQRVRLFIEAALRRHDEEHAGIASAPVRPVERAPRAAGPKRGSSPPLAAIGAVVAIVAAGIAWFALRDDDPQPAVTSNTPTAADAASVTDRLKQADAAFERGDLLAPPASSAATLYQQVLASNPDDPRALAGMDRVVNAVLTSAEQSILAGRLDAASTSVEAARKLQPDNVRIEFLNAQIGKERERALLARARAAAANGNLGAAIAVLDGASSPAGGDSLLSETRRSLEQQQVGERLRTLLRQAGERMQRGALVEPASDNAQFYIESARTLAPRDAAVLRVAQQFNNRLLAQAREAAGRGDAAATERWLRAAADAGIEARDITAIRVQLASTQNTTKSNEGTRLSALISQRITQGRLLEPPQDSARHWLDELQKVDSGGPAWLAARQALQSAELAEGRSAVSRGDAATAARMLADAESLGASTAELGALSAEVSALRERERQQANVIGASALKRTRYVEPVYPRAARDAGTSGWVDLEFIVRPDGSTSNARVINSAPAEIFDRAALEAIGKWRFEPVVRDGKPVDQRTRLRMRFALE